MKYALLVLLVACKSKPPPAAKPAPDPYAPVLVAAGNQPRQVVRYHLSKGSKVELELAVDTEMKVEGMGSSIPTQLFTLAIECDDVLPDGRMQVHAKIIDATARETGSGSAAVPATALAGRLALLKGVSLSATLSPDGALADVKPDASAALPGDTGNLIPDLARLAMRLPHDPIGAGARWTTARELAPGGVHVTTSTTVDVTGVTADTLAYKSTTELHGADQQVTLQGVPIEMSHIAGSGAGSGTIELTKLGGDSELDLALHADMTAQGSASPLELHTKIAVHGAHSAP